MRALRSVMQHTTLDDGVHAWIWATDGAPCTVRLALTAGAAAVLADLCRDEALVGRVDDVLLGIAGFLAEVQEEDAGLWAVALHANDPTQAPGGAGAHRFAQLLQRLHRAGLVDRPTLDALGGRHPALRPTFRSFTKLTR